MPQDKLEKLDKLKKIMQLANEDYFSHKEAVRFFEMASKIIKDTKLSLKNDLDSKLNSNKKEIESLINSLNNAINIKKSELEALISKSEKENSKQIKDFMLSVVKDIEKVKKSIPKEIDLSDIYEKFDKIVIPSSDEIEEKIVKNLPKYGERYRDALELLQGDERLDKSAIKDLDEEIARLEKKISSIPSGGGVSNLRIQQAFKYILKTEAPVGDIDGVNTEYTVSQPIFAVLAFSLNGEVIAQLPNYTISGNKITFSSALPSAYSGKDFEIKYV